VATKQQLIDALEYALRHARPEKKGTEEWRQWDIDVGAVKVALSGLYGWGFLWADFSEKVNGPKDADRA
jgi:hypothetical protein